MTASLASPTIAVLEDSEVLNELAEASRKLEYGFQSPGRACTGMLALVARYLQLAGFTAAVGLYFSWLAAAGVLAVVMLFRYGHRGGERRYTAILPELAPRLRKHFYLRRLGTDAFSGKEIRVFGLIDWLRECHREAYLSWMLPLWDRRHIHRQRRSRQSPAGLLLVILTRENLAGIDNDNATARAARHRIRGLLNKYDTIPSAAELTSFYGDANGREWRQYWLDDANTRQPAQCPLTI